MHLEDGLALGQVGKIYMYLAVETSGTQQSLVEHISPVGGRHDDDTRVGTEAVHLGKQGIEGILALVVSSHGRILAARTSHGIDLINENDARSLFLSLAEYVADAAGTHADKHLNKVGTTHGKERHAGLSGHSLRQQRLTRSGRADKQGALRNLSTQVGVALRILQKIHDLLHFLFGTLLSGYILEGDAHLVALLIEFGLALADVEHTAAIAAASHSAHEKPQHSQ